MSTRSAAMKPTTTKPVISIIKLLPAVIAAVALLLTATAHAAAPGITGTTFNLTAQAAYISQPDGSMIYSWGYACSSGGTAAPASIAPTTGTVCSNVMQVPGPTLIVTQGQTVTINLTNNLPAAAGNTSILFPGLNLAAGSSGVVGLLTREAAPGSTVSYSFVASSPGTRAYYSGTQGDLQVEMGLYGAIIVLPSTTPTNCTSGLAAQNRTAQAHWSESNYTLARAAYNHPQACYDREYLFQFSEMDPRIHRQAQEQVAARSTCVAGAAGCSLEVATEPYLPAYYMINGRSMPDDMDPNYAPEYPHQPYNGNPHMHPGEQVLLRDACEDSRCRAGADTRAHSSGILTCIQASRCCCGLSAKADNPQQHLLAWMHVRIPELCARVSAPALQRESSHASRNSTCSPGCM